MAKRDYYDVLGVQKNASDTEIKKAFRTLAKENHPDSNQGDAGAETRFKEISEAYENLKDPQTRAAYDQFGHAGTQAGGMGGGMGGARSSSVMAVAPPMHSVTSLPVSSKCTPPGTVPSAS